MTIHISADIEAVLAKRALERGMTAEQLAEEALWVYLLSADSSRTSLTHQSPEDAWEEKLLSIGFDTGVALSDEETRREHFYEDAV